MPGTQKTAAKRTTRPNRNELRFILAPSFQHRASGEGAASMGGIQRVYRGITKDRTSPVSVSRTPPGATHGRTIPRMGKTYTGRPSPVKNRDLDRQNPDS